MEKELWSLIEEPNERPLNIRADREMVDFDLKKNFNEVEKKLFYLNGPIGNFFQDIQQHVKNILEVRKQNEQSRAEILGVEKGRIQKMLSEQDAQNEEHLIEASEFERSWLRERLTNAVNKKVTDMAVEEFLQEVLDNNEIRELMAKEKMIPLDKVSILSIYFGIIVKKGSPGRMSDDLFNKVLKKHVELFNKKEGMFNKLLVTINSEFEKKVTSLINDCKLPLSIEDFKAKTSGIIYHLYEGLKSKNPQQEGIIHDKRYIGVSSHLIDLEDPKKTFKKVKEIVFHENVHAISGKGYLADISKEKVKIWNQKNGLELSNQNEGKGIFNALNEGVTQLITEKILGKKTTYYNEQKEDAQKVIEAGVGEDLLFKAYFENTEKSRTALKELITIMNEKFGRKNMINLSKKDILHCQYS